MAVSQTNLIAAAQNDFLVYMGDTTTATLAFFTADQTTEVDMTGASIEMDINNSTNTTTVETFNTTGGDITIDGNQVTIKGWERLVEGTYVYDFEVTIGASKVTYLVGKVQVTKDVTVV